MQFKEDEEVKCYEVRSYELELSEREGAKSQQLESENVQGQDLKSEEGEIAAYLPMLNEVDDQEEASTQPTILAKVDHLHVKEIDSNVKVDRFQPPVWTGP